MSIEETIITILADWLEEWCYLNIWRSKNVPDRILISGPDDTLLSATNGKLRLATYSIRPQRSKFEAELTDPESINNLLLYINRLHPLSLKNGWEFNIPSKL